MIKKLRVTDALIGVVLILIGIFVYVDQGRHFDGLSMTLIGSGIVNLLFAWLSPAKMMHTYLRKRLVRRQDTSGARQ